MSFVSQHVDTTAESLLCAIISNEYAILVQRLFRRQYNLRLRETVPKYVSIMKCDRDMYLDMLQLYAVSQPPDGTIYQQDVVPPHFSNIVRTFLDEQSPARWIGRESPYITWPARSPDLTLPDFFLWGFVKDQVYRIVRDLADFLCQ